MKKIGIITLTIVLAFIMFYFELQTAGANENKPLTYYKVYLDGDLIGIIDDKSQLEQYIDKQNENYKKEYNIDTIYAPNGLDIKADVLYSGSVDKIEEIYEKIQERKPFTIKGYQYTITSSYTDSSESYDENGEEITKVEDQEDQEDQEENDNRIKIYVLDKEVFNNSIDIFIKTFAGNDAYEAYKNNTQKAIETTGTIINNVYIKNNITVKEVNIPVTNKIYTNQDELSKYLLFGENQEEQDYTVNDGDTIETVAFANKISSQELLLSNPTFTSVNNLLFTGQVVKIGVPNPQIQVVIKQFMVEDVESAFTTEIKYDSSKLKGDNSVEREGENGLNRVSKELEVTNGIITTTITKNIEELKPSVSKIMVYGDKVIPNVGTGNWLWPTRQGYTISSTYGYRVDPIDGSRSLHTGLDIAGTGLGSPVYASDNGTVIKSQFSSSYGNYIIINHNNGYYTLYAHMSKLIANVGDTVAQGQTIGLVGSTGRSTGPHLHFEAWRGGAPFAGGTRFNPYELFR